MPEAAASSLIQSSPPASPPFAYADVLVPRHLDRCFTYVIPPHLQARLFIGNRVLIPFAGSRIQGIIISLYSDCPTAATFTKRPDGTEPTLRSILDVLDERPDDRLPAELIAVSHLISERYLASWGQCLRHILPVIALPHRRIRYVLTESGRAMAGHPEKLDRLPLIVRAVIARLAASVKGLASTTLRQAVRGPLKPALAHLRRKGWLHELESGEPRGARRKFDSSDPGHEKAPNTSELPLLSSGTFTCENLGAVDAAMKNSRYAEILSTLSSDDRLRFLLHAAEAALCRDRTVLLITPEIPRAVKLATCFASRWGRQVALFHGGLAAATRADTWSRIRDGRAKVVVGTRSAVFSPLSSIGLICIEDDDDPSLKEETQPRYHARDVASMRARLNQAVLLLISTHPALETVYAIESHSSDLPSQAPTTFASVERYFVPVKSDSPAIECVDLRCQPYDTILSDPIIKGVQAALASRAGVMLFLNRKGFAAALSCRDCGRSPRCPRCSIALTFYRQAGRLCCRYCGASRPLPDACEECRAVRLEAVGTGTERLEATVRRLFGQAKIRRLDSDVPRPQAEVIYRQACSGEIDILIGTQMIIQDSQLPRVGFVGLINADAGLHVPDYRAGERTYHRLLDAVSMAQSRGNGGQVVLQTYLPMHHVIAAVVTQTPQTFYEQELSFRRVLEYPPFGHVISLQVSGNNDEHAMRAAERWAKELKAAAEGGLRGNGVTILGPVQPAVAQVRGRYRWQILMKSPSAQAARETVRATLAGVEQRRGRGGLKYDIDVGPLAMS